MFMVDVHVVVVVGGCGWWWVVVVVDGGAARYLRRTDGSHRTVRLIFLSIFQNLM